MLRRYLQQLVAFTLQSLVSVVIMSCGDSNRFSLQLFGDKESVGAEVIVDSKSVGMMQTFGQDGAHFSMWLPHGSHTVEVKKTGYAPHRTNITVERGKSEHYLQIEMKPPEKRSS